MKISNPQPWSTKSRPKELISRNTAFEQAFCVDSTSFWTIMNRILMRAGRHTNAAVGIADPNALANTLDVMAHDDKHPSNNKDRNHTTPAREESPVVKVNRKELRSPIQVKVKFEVETALRKEIRSTSRNLFDAAMCDVLTTGYYTATNDIKVSSFLFVESVVTEMIYRGVLDEMLN